VLVLAQDFLQHKTENLSIKVIFKLAMKMYENVRKKPKEVNNPTSIHIILFLSRLFMALLPRRHAYTSPLPEIYKIDLPNGAEFYPIRRGNVKALKLELSFAAGRPFEEKIGLATATLQLFKGGTQRKSATRLADGFDYWGSSVNLDFYIDTCGIKLFALEKYLPQTLSLLVDMLTAPRFPKSELNLYKRQQKEKLRSDQSRGDVVAYRHFTENLFGTQHPYGYNSTPETIDQITRDDLFSHYRKNYSMTGCRIFLSGNFSDQTQELIAEALGSMILAPSKPVPKILIESAPAPSKQKITLEASVQSSIRLGRRMFKRDHPDFEPMFMLNTLLGGYYGSRLMQNLREKKGLTYHIYSSLDTFLFGGYFLISTEVDKSRSELALNQIKKEIKRLQEQPVPARELETVKHYLKGSFLNYFENAFAYSELVRALSLEGGIDTFKKLLVGLENVDSSAILDLANKYFQEKDLTLVMIS